MSSKAAQINTLIMTGNLTNDDLVAISSAISYVRSQLAKKNIWTMRPGMKVTFTSSRTGTDLTGTVAKVGRKFVRVTVGTTVWRVPANMLSKAA